MGKLSEIFSKSLLLSSAYANKYSVTNCGTDVSTFPDSWIMSHWQWLIVQIKIQGALSLEIDAEYFKNNIADDGSYAFDGSRGVYKKTITAGNLDFSVDADGKLEFKLFLVSYGM